jgi:hypothetical protein
MPLAGSKAGMNDNHSLSTHDEDLARWAQELGVTYEELRSTLDYAGPTFRDRPRASDARLAGSSSIPS